MYTKKSGVITVYKSDGSVFLFPKLFVKLYKLDKNMFASDDIIDKYIYKYSYYYSLNCLSRREHSKLELKNKLRLKNISNDIIDKTLEDLIANNYLSNDRFIESFIRSKKEKSKKELFVLLQSKGIGYKECEKEINNIDEKERIEKLIIKKIKSKKTKEQIIRYLVSKGFNYYEVEKIYNNIKV